MKEINIGDWVTSNNYGEAVCIGVINDLVKLRYEAIRVSDNKTIWVENIDGKDDVQFLKSADEVSKYVLTLSGAYGENKEKINKKKSI